MSATTIFRKIAHPTARQPRFVFDALHVAVFHFYFRLAWLGERFSFKASQSWWLSLPFTLRGMDGKDSKIDCTI
jgi:hypothetical protein